MAKTAKRKHKPVAAIAKRRRLVDLLDITPPRTTRTPPETPPEELLEQKKAEKQVRRVLQTWSRNLRDALSFHCGPVLELPDDWAPTLCRPEPKGRLRPQQELCRRVFQKLFPDGRIPDEVELSTTSLTQMIAIELEREAKQTGKKPLRTPSWDIVRTTRRNP